MRKLGLTLFLGMITFFVFAQKTDPYFFDKMAFLEKSHFIKKSTFVESQNYNLTDVIYQRMEWEINPNVLYIKGVITTHFKSKTQNLKEIEFDLHNLMTVDSVVQNNLENAQSKTPVTAEIMKLYNELIGEYPFASEKYGHAQFGWGRGMEHQTMSFMNNFDFGLISHELAHQWFGDYITLGSWQDIWLNEGFASYLAGLSYEHLLKDV